MTNENNLISTIRHAFGVTRLGLSCLLVVLLGSHAHGANTFANAAPLATGRYSHTTTLLPNGKVLVAGGAIMQRQLPLASAEIFDPATGVGLPPQAR